MFPGSSGALLEVFVSAVSSPSRFWLQIVGPQVEELDKLVDLMTEYYNNSENRDLHKVLFAFIIIFIIFI